MLCRTYGFDVISAVVPSLIAPEVMSVQALQAKHGAIFYLQYLYGSDKGNIKAGTPMNNPFTGVDGEFNYSNDYVDGEVIGSGTGTSLSTNLTYTPIRPGTIEVYKGTTLIAKSGTVESGVDTLAAENSSGASGTVNLQTGAVAITVTAGSSSDVYTIKYRYDMDLTTVPFSQVDLDLKSISVEAFPRKLRARWLLDAAYELQQMKGELVAA